MIKTIFIVMAGFFSLMFVNPVSAAIIYWSLFNVEGESSSSVSYVTYPTLQDMLNDENRVDVFTPGGFTRNVVGSGAMIIDDGFCFPIKAKNKKIVVICL